MVRFTLSPAAAKALAQYALLDVSATPPRGKNLVEDWFDTPGLTLLRNGAALSLVKARRGFLQSLRRGEDSITVPISGPAPDLAAFPPEQAEPLAALLQDEPLAPVLTTRIKRLTRQAGAVELHFETGFIQTAEEKHPVCELELRGPGAALYRLALALQDEHELLLQPVSLLQRGIWSTG
ncbi:MAG TPA: hypothetical protein VEQ16_03760, partial [Acidocella sp.]|nr:hypothetical protein [Acidocella sp.]